MIKKSALVTVLFAFSFLVFAQSKTANFDAKAAWEELSSVLLTQYAYFDREGVDGHQLLADFESRFLQSGNEQAFADNAQVMLRHFYDPHLNLGPYNDKDYSVYPTGSDVYVTYEQQVFVIKDVKAGSAAFEAGVRPNMQVVEIDGLPIAQAVKQLTGEDVSRLLPEQINYAANVSLGGLRNTSRVLTVKTDSGQQDFHLAATYKAINALRAEARVSDSRFDDIGYIRFNNALGDNVTVTEFAQALTRLADTKGLIIDLRNTPSGGNTGVAEPVLGHFVTGKTAYQRYQVQSEGQPYHLSEMRTAYVVPNEPHYDKPVVVLAGRWTGSMGEGMTIGFDAIGVKTVIGAPMADLLGGIKTVSLEHSNTWMEMGFERLYHIDGSFREAFVPHIELESADTDSQGQDPGLQQALDYFRTLLRAE